MVYPTDSGMFWWNCVLKSIFTFSENNEPNDNASITSSSTISTTTISNSGALNANDNNAAAAELVASGGTNNGEECDGNQNVSSVGDSQQSIPSEIETTTTTTATSNPGSQQTQQQKRSGPDTKSPSQMNCELSKKVLRRNLKHVKSECALLLRQISKAKEDNRKSEESMVAKAKYDELEAEVSLLPFYIIELFSIAYFLAAHAQAGTGGPAKVRRV